MTRARPNPFQWLWYALGGRLPARLREWVLHDVTTKTWMLRFGVRSAIRMVPVIIVVLAFFLILGGPLWIAFAACGIGLIVAVYYSMSYAWERCDILLTRYGYPAEFGTATRHQRQEVLDADKTARYNAQWRGPAA
jgi:hypothetical protein